MSLVTTGMNYAFTVDICQQISPTHLNFAGALAGIATPDPEAPFSYCQPGCGFGITLLPLAANYPHGRFHGIDSDPAQIAHGRALAAEAGLDNIEFHTGSTAEIAAAGGRDFDFMSLHGLWSFVDDAERVQLANLLDKRLKPGGVAYLSYKVLPGKTPLDPIYRLMTELTPPDPDMMARVAAAKNLLREILANPPAPLVAAMPATSKLIQEILDEDDIYVGHEYFLGGWHPFYCSDVFRALAPAGLSFVSSTLPGQMFDEEVVPAEHKARYDGFENVIQRQLFRDLLLNTNFRRDLLVREPKPRKASAVHLSTPFATIFRPQVALPSGKVELPPEAAELFAAAKQAPMILELPGQPSTVLKRLIRTRHLAPFRPPGAARDLAAVGRYNRAALGRAAAQGEAAWLASSATGGAIEALPGATMPAPAELERLGVAISG
jgi:predicted O-methyltransferase YrrM